MIRYLFLPCVFLLISFGLHICTEFSAGPPVLSASSGQASAARSANPSWIWADTTQDNQTVLLRRVVSLSSVPQNAILSITADDVFTLYVNGRLVAHVPSGLPVAGTEYWRQMRQYDLAPYLRPGANLVAIQAFNEGSVAGVVAQLDIPGQPSLVTDTQWKVWMHNSSPKDWIKPEFDDSSWPNATSIARLNGGVWGYNGGIKGWPDHNEALAELPISQPGSRMNPPTLDAIYGLPIPHKAWTPNQVSKASWIWANTTQDHQTVLLRRVISLAHVPRNAILTITADDLFILYVNGNEAARFPDGPPADGEDYWRHVQRYDLTPFLKAGTNVLAIRAINKASDAGVVAQLDISHQSSILTDAQWKVFTGASDPDSWTGVGFDDSGWDKATVEAPLNGGIWAGGLTGWPGYDEALVPYVKHITLPVAHVLDVQAGDGKIEGAEGLAGHTDAVLTVTPAPLDTGKAPSLLLDFGREVSGRIQITPVGGNMKDWNRSSIYVGTGESVEEAVNRPWEGKQLLTVSSRGAVVADPPTQSMGSMIIIYGASGPQARRVYPASAYTPYRVFRYALLTFPGGIPNSPSFRIHVSLDEIHASLDEIHASLEVP